jgi:multidrug efflux system membrane fusion protein
MSFVLVTLGLLGYGAWRLGMSHGQATDPVGATGSRGASRPVPVSAAPAKAGDIPIYLDGLGTVVAFNTVTVKSRVDGTLESVAFKEGQVVHAGDLLAMIDPRPYQVQLEQAEGQMARDQAILQNAKVDLTRYQTLFQEDSIPKQQLDTQVAAVAQVEGALTTDQAAIDNARLQLTYCRITAPISGRIGLRLVDAGNIVHANDANGLLVITQVQPMAVVFTIPEDSLPAVLKRLRAGEKLPVEAYDRSGAQRLATGELLTVDNEIDTTTGMTRLKAVYDNRDEALFPNQFVNVRLLLDTRQNAVIVPVVALQRGPKGPFVYVLKADRTAEVRPVKPGPAEGNDVSIEAGLSAGETVVVDGMDRLRSGSTVTLERPAGGGREALKP